MTAPTLTGFLLARIAEDEAVAQSASQTGRADMRWEVWSGEHGLDSVVRSASRTELAEVKIGEARHIARHDPARVLAECEAKRHIVAQAESFLGGADMDPFGVEQMLESLAAVYADHPDYDEAWRA